MIDELKATLFPIRLHAIDNKHSKYTPELAMNLWMRVRGDTTWYTVDCEIMSRDEVVVYVYEMWDSVHGGIGQRIRTVTMQAPFPPSALKLINKEILKKQLLIAASAIDRRAQVLRDQEIEFMRSNIFGGTK